MVEPIIRIEIDGRTQLLDRLVPLMRENKNGTQVAIEAGRERIDLQTTLRLGDCFIAATHDRQEP